MRIKALKEDLLKATQIVQNVISPHTTLPVLSNILIETVKDRVRLISTDLDIGISYSFFAKVEEEGAITIPAKKVSDIFRELPGENIEILTKKNNAIEIKSNQSYFRLIGIPKDEFPKLPNFKNKEFIILPQNIFKRMIEVSSFAISKDETRYILNGALVEIKEDGIRMVTTDGRRLVLVEERKDFPKGIDKKIIIPSKTIHELLRNLSNETELKIAFDENQIYFEFNEIVIISRLIEGNFPEYEKVIPKETKNKVKTDKNKLYQAIKRVSLLTNPNSQAIKIDILKDKMMLSKNTPEIGEAKDQIDIDYKGDTLSIGFNPIYLMEVLRVFEKDVVEIELTDPQKPAVIRMNTPYKYIYIVLPMQLI